ncbi:N-acetyltransferase [Pseudonocardiaceae bacterium YIM PH 21723]|nr:N-acetyltransferase [Pseudonocardiaceae bacterium YIM PH 21723]
MIWRPIRSGLAGAKVRLREIDSTDRHTLARFDRDSGSSVGGFQHWAAHRACPGDAAQYVIETVHSRLVVGSMWVVQAGPRTGWFSYGIGIGSAHRRCGYASDAISVLLGHMFTDRGYRTCEVSVHGGNLASLTLHGALGFLERSRLRDTELRPGSVNYVVQLGIEAAQFTGLPVHRTALRPMAMAGRGRHWRRRRGRHWQVQHLR